MAPKGSEIITAGQCRAARAWLNMSAQELSVLTGVHRVTIARFESGRGDIIQANAKVLRKALEDAGCEFPDLDTVRLLRTRKPQDAAAKQDADED
mgnify:CR=1 FL=1